MKKKEKQFPVLLTHDQYNWLKQESRRRDLSMGALVREYINKAKELQDANFSDRKVVS